MRAFQYKHGDRPLEGYTIQRAAGRGGFGEVYYALSDSGREVALKVIQGFEQIELRGVSQCMNLKSPHLVSIFDVRHNDQGVPFVIMEFVSGPSLRELIDQTPGGLGTQKSAFFLREMAKGLSYLHDCGIVHRDLKPGNIFYENGYVKIGDYGLSKSMSASQHSGQTVTVGTVHYMAPEIGMGRYDKSIDIYALGAVLYEMLTGQVPYLGASPGEILMKHLSATPDVSGIEEPFATVIKKSMAKDPKDRYQSVREMVEAVFGAEHVRQSVGAFSPEALTMVAGRVAAPVAVAAGGSSGAYVPPIPPPPSDTQPWTEARWEQSRIGRIGNRLAAALPDLPENTDEAAGDPLPRKHRHLLGLVTLVGISMAAGMATVADSRVPLPLLFLFSLFCSVGAVVGLNLARQRLLPKMANENPVGRRLTAAACAAAGMMLPAILFSVIGMAPGARSASWGFINTFMACAVAMLIFDWIKPMSPTRPQRVTLGPVILATLAGLILCALFHGSMPLGMGILAATSLASQMAAPWHGARRAAGIPRPRQPEPVAVPRHLPPPLPQRVILVHHLVRWLVWRLGAALVGSLGIVCLAAPTIDRMGREEEGAFVGAGLGLLFLAALALGRSFTQRVNSWWGYLLRPLMLWVCAMSFSLAMGITSNSNLRDEEFATALFFILFPGVVFFMLLATPTNRPGAMQRMLAQSYRGPGAVPPLVRLLCWRLPAALCAALSISFLSMLDHSHGFEEGLFIGLGLGGGYLAVMCFARSFTQRVNTWWGYLIKPLVMGLCFVSVSVAGSLSAHENLRGEEAIAALFFIVFPGIAFLVMLFLPGNRPQLRTAGGPPPLPGRAPAYLEQPYVEQAYVEPAPAPAPEPLPEAPVAREPAASSTSLSSAAVQAASTATRAIFTLIAAALILLALGVGFLAAIDVPGYVHAGLADPVLAANLERDIGPAWVGLSRNFLWIFTYAAFAVTAALLIIMRRNQGPAHMLRALLACCGFVAALNILDRSLPGDWPTVAHQAPATLPLSQPVEVESPAAGAAEHFTDPRSGPRAHAAAVGKHLASANSAQAGQSLLFAGVALTVLLWPAKKNRPQTEAKA